jgi:hypothetical protein
MNVAVKLVDNQEFATKTELRWLLNVAYGQIADAIRRGELALHLIDGKIMLNVAEAKALCGNKKPRAQSSAPFAAD